VAGECFGEFVDVGVLDGDAGAYRLAGLCVDFAGVEGGDLGVVVPDAGVGEGVEGGADVFVEVGAAPGEDGFVFGEGCGSGE
jgi:hypothetical protein